MNKKGPILERVKANPLLAIEMVLCFVLLFGGAILINPWLVINPVTIENSAVLQAVAPQVSRTAIGSFLMVGPFMTLFGIKNENSKLRATGLLLMFLAFLFLLLLRTLTLGAGAGTWISILAFTLMSGICRLAAREGVDAK